MLNFSNSNRHKTKLKEKMLKNFFTLKNKNKDNTSITINLLSLSVTLISLFTSLAVMTSLLSTIFLFAPQALAFDHTHADWNSVLEKYRNSIGLINYKDLKTDSSQNPMHKLNSYIEKIESVSELEYNSWSENQKKSFLINSYNALTLKLIVKNYPVKSIKKIGGLFSSPWKIEFFSLFQGKIKSLDPIEHVWLRPQFKDLRIHAAVNCASISCPVIGSEALVPERIDQQLDLQMKSWLTDKSRNFIDPATMSFTISKIFDWYKEDFEKWDGGVLNVIRKYYVPQISKGDFESVKLKYLEYNWDLNEVAQK